ncbi:hypothetical protein [Polynucleobacter sp. MWH-UH2A]|uniref:hypothetical protein n=1 Tax=Polynucleobacter sp. MWH-UH2A TaxID=1855617 RepID=UPI001BFD016C|nr:hypothetical protein [Polynucleobacter sp. MWH-UH2A]QWD65029.1 hypothetical protein IC571_05275 [Polynucleobacter sp. MWH-UH2A]
MHKISAILISLLVAMPAYSAGLGFNPFDAKSPTSATGSVKPNPTAPAPAAPVAPKTTPIPPAAPASQTSQAPNPAGAQNKK